MRHDLSSLDDMLYAARKAMRYLGERPVEIFLRLEELQDCVRSALITVGEAERRISSPLKLAQPDIPWKEMAGLRNIVTHNYDGIDWILVHKIVMVDLPQLCIKLELLIQQYPSRDNTADL